MADKVKTSNIPGIGTITIEGASSEETLLAILAAVSKTEKSKSTAEKEAAKALKDWQTQLKASGKTQEEIDEATKTRKELEATTAKKREAEKVKGAKDEAESRANLIAAGAAVGNGLLSLAKSVISLTTSFATSYDRMLEDPIQAALGIQNTYVDIQNNLIKSSIDATGSFVKSVFGLIPGVSWLVDMFSSAGKAASDLAAELRKTYNEQMSTEFKKSVTALQAYTKVGASFAGGMAEMRTIANDAGLSMVTLQKSAIASSEDLRRAGLSQGEGVAALAKGMSGLSGTVGKSGNSLRDEMLALGYSYEEQGQMAAQQMALDKAAGVTRTRSTSELAQQTASYAKDLKLLADITGKDAKKAMEEAGKAGMQADIMAQLSPEEAKKFQAAYAAMPDYAKKGFLEYVSSGGTAIADASTNIAMNQNAEFEKLVKGSFSNIKNSSMDVSAVQKETMRQTAVAGKAQREYVAQNGSAIAVANRFTGAMQGTTDIQNGMLLDSVKQADAVEKSAKAHTAQSESVDAQTAAYQKLTDATNKNAVFMENLAGSKLADYTKDLANTFVEASEKFRKAMDTMFGPTKETTEKAAQNFKKTEEIDKAKRAGDAQEVQAIRTKQAAEITSKATTKGNSKTSKELEAELEPETAVTAIPKKAKGGITAGLTLAGEEGPEAVVPLPDGKSIPVSMSGSNDRTNTMLLDAVNNLLDICQQQLDMQTKMTDHVNDNKNLTQKLLHATI